MDALNSFFDPTYHKPYPNICNKNDEMPLHIAVRSKEANTVKSLLDAGADVNALDSHGNTPLHSAVKAKAVAAVKILLRHSATDVNARTQEGDTPLILASSYMKKKQQLLVDLVNAGADVNAADSTGKTALHWAAELNYVCKLDLLLDFGANKIARDKQCRTPLHLAAISNGANAVKRLLDAGADANIQDNDGYTPLHLNVVEDDLIVFRTLLHHTTNLNSVTNKDSTPLTTAVYMGLVYMVIYLINAGANVNAADNRGKTALHWASDFSDLLDSKHEDYHEEDFVTRRARISRYLLDSGADANAKDNLGNTPLHIAIESEASTVLDILLRHPATDLNARRTSDGKTPLMIMFESEYVWEEYILKEHGFLNLITAGADIRVMDYRGKTILHYAAKWDDAEAMVMELLLKDGADVNFADKAGMTALHTSVESNAWAVFELLSMHPAIDLNVHRISDGKTPLMMMIESDPDLDDFEHLLEAGADISATDNEGKTALHYAAKLDKIAEINALLGFGANADVQDRKGQTPLHLAAGTGSFYACRFLVAEFFANRDIADNMGKLPRDVASERDHEHIVMLLNDFMPAG